MSVTYLRRAGVWQRTPAYRRNAAGAWVKLRPETRLHPSGMSAIIFPGPTWGFSRTQAGVATRFPDGTNRNLMSAFAEATSGSHTYFRSWNVLANTTYRLTTILQKGSSARVGYEWYTDGTTFISFADLDLDARTASAGILTHLGGGVFRYELNITTPATISTLQVRCLLQNSSGATSYVGSGTENHYAGEVTLI